MNTKSSKNDLTNEQIQRFRKLEKAFLSRCRHFGYQEIKTSTIEPLYIFTAHGGLRDDKINRIYSFIDWDGWSGERVALKPDSTTCVARYWGDHLRGEKSSQKLCYVENHFEWADAWDVISERWQCGVENIGDKRSESDVEVIYMGLDILRAIGLKNTYLYLSYPSVIRAMVQAMGLEAESEKKLIEIIRNGEDYRAFLKECPVMEERIEELAMFLSVQSAMPDYNANYLENLKRGLHKKTYQEVAPALENFISICRRLDALECKYIIDFNLLGELEYYTGVKFTILSRPARKPRMDRRDIVCSGGRYDNLIAGMWELEETVPAVGFALFVRNAVPHIRATTDKLQNICVYIGNITFPNVKTGQDLCDKLSGLGFSAKISLTPIRPEDHESYGLVIEVNHDIHPDGYQVIYSQKIGQPLLRNLFGEFNDR